MIALGIGEADVRRRAGDGVFARADLLQRSGHVLGPTTSSASVYGGVAVTLTGDVRGLWRRVDQAKVVVNAGETFPSCTCGLPGFCQHAAALLLHALREPSWFGMPAPAAVAPTPNEPAPAIGVEEDPIDELARMLDLETTTRLRAIAQSRGLAVRAGNKADLIQRLTPALAEPAGVDAALARLTADERRVLEAAHFVATARIATDDALAAAYVALGGAGPPPIGRLLELGLLLHQPIAGYGPPHFAVPGTVASRLSPPDNLLPSAEAPSAEPTEPIGLDELVHAIVHYLTGHEANWRLPDSSETHRGGLPAGWRLDRIENAGADLDDLLTMQPIPGGRRLPADLVLTRADLNARLLPAAHGLARADVARLAARTGAPPAAVSFVVRLLTVLGVVEGADRPRLRQDELAALFSLDAAARLGTLHDAWLALADWTELSLIVGRDGPLQLRFRPTYGRGPEPPAREIVVCRRLVAHLIRRLPPGAWYGVDSLLDVLYQLRPRPLVLPYHDPQAPWFADRTGEVRLVLDTLEGWQRVARAVVEAVLGGPLTWLGLVDVAGQDRRVDAFRVRPASALLGGRDVATDGPRPGLVVADDLTVLVPPGALDGEGHAWLGLVGELVDASPAGLRFRLTAEGARSAFDAGLTGPMLLDFLAATAPLPHVVHDTIERWWNEYGMTRLYDDLCLIELGDDVLLSELLATTPLRSWLVHTFSPRLIAVDPTAVDELVAALARLGHAPRVVEAT